MIQARRRSALSAGAYVCVLLVTWPRRFERRLTGYLKTVTDGVYGFDHFRHRERSCRSTPLHRPMQFPDTDCSS